MQTAKTDQTGRMTRLICVFAGRTCHFVGFVMRWLICPFTDNMLFNRFPGPDKRHLGKQSVDQDKMQNGMCA